MANGQETIEALTKQFTEAFRARDFAAVGNMYTNDAVICPPNSNMITGKGNIQSFWEQNGRILALRFDSMSVKPLGETAMRVVGTFSIEVRSQPQGGGSLAAAGPQSREVNVKYIFVWQKIGEDWKIESSIWNRIGPERGSFPMPAAIRRLPQNNPGGGMGQGGPGGGMGPGGGPRGGGMGQGGGPRGGGTGPGSGPRGGGMDRGGPGGGQADPGGSRDDQE
jgi:ketosteroid isomerase-like protein